MVRVLGELDIFNFVCGCCLIPSSLKDIFSKEITFPLTLRALVNTTKDQICFTCSSKRKAKSTLRKEVRER